jgi:nucleoside-diphosphate-sugar epimerase
VNLGREEKISIRKLAEMIVEISGKKIQIILDLSRPMGPLSSMPDLSKAREVLNWEPQVKLEDALKATYSNLETRILGI